MSRTNRLQFLKPFLSQVDPGFDVIVIRKHYPKTGLRKLSATLWLMLLVSAGHAQGSFNQTITFGGFPPIGPQEGFTITNYSEAGMIFTPIEAGDQFVRVGGEPMQTAFPRNGGQYLLFFFQNSLAGARSPFPTLDRFGLVSVDLSEFSTVYDVPRRVQFIGYRFDGAVVTTELTTDGIIDGSGPIADFETFYFDERFSDLVRFEVPTDTYAMDNLVFFDVVPEPNASTLLLLGIILVAARTRKRRLCS